jgi:hypothetical protein
MDVFRAVRSIPAVAVGSIRLRILKEGRCSGLDPTEDTERPPPPANPGPDAGVAVGSIRLRIRRHQGGCSGLDPTGDTERSFTARTFPRPTRVAVGSIRLRILKGLPARRPRGSGPSGCSGLDPTEDTERSGSPTPRRFPWPQLQWARSDRMSRPWSGFWNPSLRCWQRRGKGRPSW